MMLRVTADEVAPQAWHNGGGRTRELLTWPTGRDWALRISLADIDADGPFSAFPGIERWFAVTQGSGVLLTFDDRQLRMTEASAPLRFDGGDAPSCALLDGPTRDLNLMIRTGAGVMREAQPGVPWSESFAQRGLFARVTGSLHFGHGESIILPAGTLVWGMGNGPCRFTPEARTQWSPAPAWWLGYTTLWT
jgi:environmental stress-induced protein Ves